MSRTQNRALRWSPAGDRRTVKAPGEPPEHTGPENTDGLHGYTVADIDVMARMSLSRTVGVVRGTTADRYAAAWHAIAVALCEADARPDRADLLRVGADSARDEWRGVLRHHGQDTDKGVGVRPSFVCYWTRPASGDPSGGVVDRVALRQIWPLLSATHREVLTAQAVAVGDQDVAAAALGVTKGNYQYRLSRARAAFLACWHDGEEPSQVWRPGLRRRTSTAACGTPAGAQRHRRAGEQCCDPCAQAWNSYERDRRKVTGDVS